MPFSRVLGGTACSVVISVSLLGIGIAITTLSIHNYTTANKIFLIGPVLMTAGVLGMSRLLMRYLRKLDGQTLCLERPLGTEGQIRVRRNRHRRAQGGSHSLAQV